MAHAGKEIGFREIGFFRRRFGSLQLDVGFLPRPLKTFAFGDVARRRKHSLKLPVAVVESGRVARDYCFLAVPGTRGKLIVGNFTSVQHPLDAGFGPLRIGEAVLERRPNQLIARAAGEHFHLLVDVGDDAGRIGGH